MNPTKWKTFRIPRTDTWVDLDQVAEVRLRHAHKHWGVLTREAVEIVYVISMIGERSVEFLACDSPEISRLWQSLDKKIVHDYIDYWTVPPEIRVQTDALVDEWRKDIEQNVFKPFFEAVTGDKYEVEQ